MNFNIALHTDVGITKTNNQDSVCIKQAQTEKGNILLALICDGMGGLSKGELASATLIHSFSKWFENELPFILIKENYLDEVRYRWERMIKEQNQNIADYGRANHIQLGTTLTAIIFFEDGQYLIGHVGDTRIYRITNDSLNILTNDQTLVANEVKLGRLTAEQAEVDPRRNVLLQCVGASKIVQPDFVEGRIHMNECYMLCSDGFRHVVTKQEIMDAFRPNNNLDESMMKDNIIRLIELNKQRGETDNISCILVKTL